MSLHARLKRLEQQERKDSARGEGYYPWDLFWELVSLEPGEQLDRLFALPDEDRPYFREFIPELPAELPTLD